jgi:hypothetical protein
MGKARLGREARGAGNKDSERLKNGRIARGCPSLKEGPIFARLSKSANPTPEQPILLKESTLEKRTWLSGLVLIVVISASIGPVEAAKDPLRLQERYSRGLLEYLFSPQYLWLDSGRVLLLDPGGPDVLGDRRNWQCPLFLPPPGRA